MSCLARHFAPISRSLQQLVAVLIAAVMLLPAAPLRGMVIASSTGGSPCAVLPRQAMVCGCGCQDSLSAASTGGCCCIATPADSLPPGDQPLPGRGNGGNRGDDPPPGKLSTATRTDAIALWMLEMSRHQHAQAWARSQLRLLGEPAIRARFGSHVRQHAAVEQWLT